MNYTHVSARTLSLPPKGEDNQIDNGHCAGPYPQVQDTGRFDAKGKHAAQSASRRGRRLNTPKGARRIVRRSGGAEGGVIQMPSGGHVKGCGGSGDGGRVQQRVRRTYGGIHRLRRRRTGKDSLRRVVGVLQSKGTPSGARLTRHKAMGYATPICGVAVRKILPPRQLPR